MSDCGGIGKEEEVKWKGVEEEVKWRGSLCVCEGRRKEERSKVCVCGGRRRRGEGKKENMCVCVVLLIRFYFSASFHPRNTTFYVLKS